MHPPPPELLREVLTAAQWAVDAHDGQQRKGSGKPYVLHPLRVATRILWAPLEPEALRITLLAAILHDTLEDTELPRDQIRDRFGDAVLAVVDELTQAMHLPKAERRQKMIEDSAGYSREARIVKLADRWDNMSELEGMPAEFIDRYCQEAEQLLEAMQGTWQGAEQSIAELIVEHRR